MQYISGPVELQGFHDKDGGSDNYSPPDSQEAVRSQWHVHHVVDELLSRSQLLATSWTAARQASLSITDSQSLLKLMSMESVMLSNHLILCHPLLLLPSIFSSIRVFSNESVLRIRWPKYWSFSFSTSIINSTLLYI